LINPSSAHAADPLRATPADTSTGPPPCASAAAGQSAPPSTNATSGVACGDMPNAPRATVALLRATRRPPALSSDTGVQAPVEVSKYPPLTPARAPAASPSARTVWQPDAASARP